MTDMNRYTLDYSTPGPRRRPSSRGANRRMRSALRRSALLLCGLGLGITLVGWFRLDAHNAQLQRANDEHRIRYDSLMASKLEAELQLLRLQQRQLYDSMHAPLSKRGR